jgi:zinc protease
MLVYRVGSADDPEGYTGMAHFLEHMVFRGTDRYGSGEIDRITLRSGGDVNAYTTRDVSAYWFRVSSEHWENVLAILAETMGKCTLDEKDIALERGPVLEEINVSLDGLWGRLEEMEDRVIPSWPGYRHPVLGNRADVERIGRQELLALYRRHYVPNDAALVILGDVDEEDAFRRADRFFGAIPRGSEIPRLNAAAPTPKDRGQVRVQTDSNPDRFMMSFRTDPLGTRASLALDVLAVLLGDGKHSRLKARLVNDEGLASEDGVLVTHEPFQAEGIFSIRVAIGPDSSLSHALAIVTDELRSLSENRVSPRELRRAKNIVRARLTFDIQTQRDLAWKIGTYEALGLPSYLENYLIRIESLEAEEIQAVAKNIFAMEGRTLASGSSARDGFRRSRTPRGSPRPDRLPGRCARSAARLLDASQPAPTLEERLPNGIRFFVSSRPELPIVTISADCGGGPLADPKGKEGLAELVSRMLDQGVRDGAEAIRSNDEISEAIEFLGGTYTIRSTGITINLMSAHLAVGLDLLRDLLRFPTFPEDAFERVQEGQLENIDAPDDSPEECARRLFFQSAYRGHRLALSPNGTKDTVKYITQEDVRNFYLRYYRPENAIIAVVGDLSPASVLRELRSRFEDWKQAGPSSSFRVEPAARQTTPVMIEKAFQCRQTRIHLGQVGVVRTNPDYPALRLMETILGLGPGLSDRLSRRLREELGLTYDVTGSITQDAGFAEAPFQVVLGVEDRNRNQAVAAVLDVLREFQEKGPTEEEVADAKRYLLGSFESNWETLEDTADYLIDVHRFELGSDYPESFQAAVGRVTRNEVIAVARKYIDLSNLTTVVVRPGAGFPYSPIGIGAVVLLGGVVILVCRRKRRLPMTRSGGYALRRTSRS